MRDSKSKEESQLLDFIAWVQELSSRTGSSNKLNQLFDFEINHANLVEILENHDHEPGGFASQKMVLPHTSETLHLFSLPC